LITLSKVNQHYGGTQIIWDLDLKLEQGSCTCIMGRNGAGKTTLLKCLMGLLPISSGTIEYHYRNKSETQKGNPTEGLRVPLHRKAAEFRAPAGIGYVPQGREIFPLLTVEENLQLGLPVRKKRGFEKVIPQKIFELFPVLHDMLHRRGGDLSGGQQQQLAIGRALVTEPDVLILDEPNEGIQPNIVKQIGDVITKLNQQGLTVILVEQKLGFARKVGKEFRLMEKGRIVAADSMTELSESLIKQYLAV